MTRALLPWAILIVLVTVLPGAWGGEPEIVARVNGEPVNRAELQRMLADPLTRARLRRELGVHAPSNKAIEQLAVKELVNRRLILQEARRRDFRVTEQDLDKALGDLRRQFTDLKTFGAWMKERGLDDKSLYDTIRADILMTRVRSALVERVSLPKKQVQKYYDAHQDKMKLPEAARLRVIAVKDRTAANQILAGLRIGADFGRLAQERSLGARAAKGGDTGWVNLQTLPPPLRDAVHRLKAGESGGPVQSGGAFVVVRLEERRPARTISLTEARPQIEGHLLATRRQEVIQAWLTEQEKKSKIEVPFHPGSITDGAVNARSHD